MPRFGTGRSITYWTNYLWAFSTDNDLADIQERICQLIGANFESYIEDLEQDYQDALIDSIKAWLELFRRKYKLYFDFLRRSRILNNLTSALSYYYNTEINTSPLSLDSFNRLAETYSIAPTVRLTYDIAYCIINLCESPRQPDWESIHLTFHHSTYARETILRAILRITRRAILS